MAISTMLWSVFRAPPIHYNIIVCRKSVWTWPYQYKKCLRTIRHYAWSYEVDVNVGWPITASQADQSQHEET